MEFRPEHQHQQQEAQQHQHPHQQDPEEESLKTQPMELASSSEEAGESTTEVTSDSEPEVKTPPQNLQSPPQQPRHLKYSLETLLNGIKEVIEAPEPSSLSAPLPSPSSFSSWSPSLSSSSFSCSSSASPSTASSPTPSYFSSASSSSSCSSLSSSSPASTPSGSSSSTFPEFQSPLLPILPLWNHDTISTLRNVVVQSNSLESTTASTSTGRTRYPTEFLSSNSSPSSSSSSPLPTLPTLASLALDELAAGEEGEHRRADRRKKTGNLPRVVTEDLKRWIIDHKSHPFPSEVEKIHFAKKHRLSLNQVNNWFINARRRVLTKRVTNTGEFYVVTDKYARKEAQKLGHSLAQSSPFFDQHRDSRRPSLSSSEDDEGSESAKVASLTLSALAGPRLEMPRLHRVAAATLVSSSQQLQQPQTTAQTTAGHYFLQAPPPSPPSCHTPSGGESLFFMFQNGLKEAKDRGENNTLEFLGKFFLNESERSKQAI